MTTAGLQVTIGGVAKVYCVHNQPKRDITDLAYNPRKTKAHLCACCENLFLNATDTPMFCPACRGANIHKLGGPLPAPKGVV